jgi:hypothetical protein
MPFSFRCLLGHSWDGCVCRRCNPEGRLSVWGWRNRGHDLDGCNCRRCHQTPHDWDGCVCRRCEATRDQEHDLRAGACARCGATIVDVREVACVMCGGSGATYHAGSAQGGDTCGVCGGARVVQENVWGAPTEPCVRPRRRADPDGRFALVRRDANVVALARSILATGDCSGYVPLLDALQEAGCTDEELLNHCRREGHTRDCWVLRLLLGVANRPAS